MASGFFPTVVKNDVQLALFQARTSTTYIKAAIITISMPVVSSVKGLLQSFLPIGKLMFQVSAMKMSTHPINASRAMVS